jgi:hypothetical protein
MDHRAVVHGVIGGAIFAASRTKTGDADLPCAHHRQRYRRTALHCATMLMTPFRCTVLPPRTRVEEVKRFNF